MQVDVQDVGLVDFPDDATDQEIQDALNELFPGQQPSTELPAALEQKPLQTGMQTIEGLNIPQTALPYNVPPSIIPDIDWQRAEQMEAEPWSAGFQEGVPTSAGITPAIVPQGQRLTEAVTAIPKEAADVFRQEVPALRALDVPMTLASSVAKTGIGLTDYLSSPQGVTELVLSMTPAKVLVLAKWAKDMAGGAYAEGAALGKLLAKENKAPEDYQQISDHTINALALGIGAGFTGKKAVTQGISDVKTIANKLNMPEGKIKLEDRGPVAQEIFNRFVTERQVQAGSPFVRAEAPAETISMGVRTQPPLSMEFDPQGRLIAETFEPSGLGLSPELQPGVRGLGIPQELQPPAPSMATGPRPVTATRAVRLQGEAAQRMADWQKAVSEKISQEQKEPVHPDKPLTANQLRIVRESLERDILQGQVPGRRGLVSGSDLELWADQVLGDVTGPQEFRSGVPLKYAGAVLVKGAAILERGITDAAQWTAEMVKEFGESIRPYLDSIRTEVDQFKKKGGEPSAIQSETAQVLRDVREPEIPQEGQVQVPVSEGRPQAAEALTVKGQVEGMTADDISKVVMQSIAEGGMIQGLKKGGDKTGFYVVAPPERFIDPMDPTYKPEAMAVGPFLDRKAAQEFLDSEVGAEGAKVVEVSVRKAAEARVEHTLESDKALYKDISDRMLKLVREGKAATPLMEVLKAELEVVKNRHEGMPPGQTSPARKTMQAQQAAMRVELANEIHPAVRIGGRVISDPNKGHIQMALEVGGPEAISEVSKPANQGFVYKGEFISREATSELLGEKTPMTSERLKEIRAEQPKAKEEPAAQQAEPKANKQKTAKEFSQDDWELISENLSDAADIFAESGAARGGGRRAYEMYDLIDQFLNFSKSLPDSTIADALQKFKDQASPTQIKKLRTILQDQDLIETKVKKGGEPIEETQRQKEVLEPETLWTSSEPQTGKPLYLSNQKADASAYALGREPKQYQVAYEKPFDTTKSIDSELINLFDKLGGIHEAPQNPKFIAALKAKGYDAIIGGEKGFAGESRWVVLLEGKKAKLIETEPTVEAVTPLDIQSGSPLSATESLINRLEALKFPEKGEGRLYSLPHPDAVKAIGRTAWNTAIDIAIAAVKSGKAIAEAVESALAHIRKNAAGKFDEAQARANLEFVTRAEAGAQRPPPIGGQPSKITEPTATEPNFTATDPITGEPAKLITEKAARAMERKVKIPAQVDVETLTKQIDLFNKEIGDALETGGQFLPKDLRPEVAKGAPAEKGTVTNKQINQYFVNKLSSLRKQMEATRHKIDQQADVESQVYFDALQKRFETAFRQVQELRRASHEALYFWNKIRAEYQEIARAAGAMPEMKRQLPILDQIWKDMREKNYPQAGKHFVDYLRMNLFTLGSWTLDFGTNLVATGARIPAWAIMDVGSLISGRPPTRMFTAMHALADNMKNWNPFGKRFRLPEKIETELGTTAGGEFPGRGKEVIIDFSEILRSRPELANRLKEIDRVIGAPVRMKRAVDSFFGRFGATAELYNRAYIEGKSRGLKGDELKQFVEEFIQTPPESALNRAIQTGKELKFNRDLTKLEEAFARNWITKVVLEAFPRWSLQFTRWGGEMLGVDPSFFKKAVTGKATPEEIVTYLTKAATGWGGIYAFNQLFYDNIDANSMEYVTEEGDRIRLSGRTPAPELFFIVALLRGDNQNAQAALSHISVPGAKFISGETAGLIGPLVDTIRESIRGRYTAEMTARELTKLVNDTIPGKSVLGLIRSIFDPTIREGIGAPIPGVASLLPQKPSPTTGEPLAPKQRIPGTSIEIPTVGGTPFPGAVRVLNDVEAALMNHGFGLTRPRRTSIIDLPAEDVPKEMRREYEKFVGQNIKTFIGEEIKLKEFQELPFDVRREILSQLMSQARQLARADMAQKYGTSMQPVESVPLNIQRMPKRLRQ